MSGGIALALMLAGGALLSPSPSKADYNAANGIERGGYASHDSHNTNGHNPDSLALLAHDSAKQRSRAIRSTALPRQRVRHRESRNGLRSQDEADRFLSLGFYLPAFYCDWRLDLGHPASRQAREFDRARLCQVVALAPGPAIRGRDRASQDHCSESREHASPGHGRPSQARFRCCWPHAARAGTIWLTYQESRV